MANFRRSGKSGNDWTETDLKAFNIAVVNEDVATFFGNPDLPPVSTTVDPTILNNSDLPPGTTTKSTRLFFQYLEDARVGSYVGAQRESAIIDFAAFLLGLLDYDEPDRIIHERMEIVFEMCGTFVDAQPGVCIWNHSRLWEYHLLLQQGKCRWSCDDPEPELIADAIAAFYRDRRIAGPSLRSKVYAGITMLGTAPMFYKIPVTADLLNSVITSQFPLQQTVVKKLIPPVPDMIKLWEEGMRHLESRRVILQCLEAFKQFV
ncbi:hypothetical protein Hypma_006166 [Hypsizygus marmoreus]|uniref:Uncharacterized protein n=1 Tax=Hypsizygus marmoreus TaxID=39966 RepID=A0A369K416_HYPMA|nr:hypothetical protein Hypma_006166 [Hypsizygus marmoreus]